MPRPPDAPPGTERLRASPSFVQTLTLDGRPFVAKDSEPYSQFWLSERERWLLGFFGRRGGATLAQAEATWARLAGAALSAAESRRLRRAVAGMREAGVLIGPGDDTSRYSRRIVRDYVAHRPFPGPVADHLVAAGGITTDTAVLDVAGGPGDLALALARHSRQVALMELSQGFLAAARSRARQQGLALATLHDSANRLVYRDEGYGVITVSQALHWLDDVMVCRGVCRLLQPGGSFFVVHSAIELADSHPLAHLLGHDSILGRKPRQAFTDELQPLQRRLGLLFEALDAPEVQRIDPTQAFGADANAPGQRIGPAGLALFRQRRPFDEGYARGFLTPTHIGVTGQSPDDFWRDLRARCAAAPADTLLGTHHWAVLHFQRGAAGRAWPDSRQVAVQAMDYTPPPERR